MAELGHGFTLTSPRIKNDTILNGLSAPIDLCFIDANHKYQGVRGDYDWLKNRCKYYMFHDIFDRDCPGVVQIWHELVESSRSSKHVECIQQPTGLREDQHKVYFNR